MIYLKSVSHVPGIKCKLCSRTYIWFNSALTRPIRGTLSRKREREMIEGHKGGGGNEAEEGERLPRALRALAMTATVGSPIKGGRKLLLDGVLPV